MDEIRGKIKSLREALSQNYDSYINGELRDAEIYEYDENKLENFIWSVYSENKYSELHRQYEDIEEQGGEEQDVKDAMSMEDYVKFKESMHMFQPLYAHSCDKMCGLIVEYEELCVLVTNRKEFAWNIKGVVDSENEQSIEQKREWLADLKDIATKSESEITENEWEFIGHVTCHIEDWNYYYVQIIGERPDLSDGHPLENAGDTYEKYKQIIDLVAELSDIQKELPIMDSNAKENYYYASLPEESEFTPEEITNMTEETGITKTETNGFKAFWEKVKTKVKNFFNKEK